MGVAVFEKVLEGLKTSYFNFYEVYMMEEMKICAISRCEIEGMAGKSILTIYHRGRSSTWEFFKVDQTM